jgi:hypothetical protein
MLSSRLSFIILLLISIVQLISYDVSGQKIFKMKIKVINGQDSSAVSFAKVSIVDTNENVFTKLTSDLDGFCNVELPDSLNHKLKLHVKGLGFNEFLSPLLSYDFSGRIAIVSLVRTISELKEVSIIEKHISKNGNKLIYRVRQDNFSSSTATIELFNKLPGITLTSAGLKRNGRDGVLILIDGKGELKDQNAQMISLASLSSDQVEKIEISSFPSAIYDASIKTVINVITKKERNFSNVRGSVGQPLFMEQDKIGSKNVYGGSSANLNFKIDKIKVSFLLSSYYNRHPEATETRTTTYGQQQFNSETYSSYSTLNLTPSFNIDYEINERSSFGLNVDMSLSPIVGMDRIENNEFYNAAFDKVDSTSVIDTRHRSSQRQYEFGGNYRYLLSKKTNSLLNLNLIYHSNPFSYHDVFNNFSVNSGTSSFENQFSSRSSIVNLAMIISDLVKSTFVSTEFGFKSNNLEYHTIQQLDLSESRFHYQENINSLFVTARWTFGKYSIVTGFRNELLNSTLNYVRIVGDLNQTVERDYFKVYPDLQIEKTISNDLTLSLGYTKKLRRPRSIFLNPSVTRTYYTSTSGNVNNLPTYFDRVEGQMLYKDLVISLFFERTSNLLFSAPVNVSNYSYQYLNAARANNWGLAVSKEFKISTWFSSTINSNLSRTSQSARDFKFERPIWTNFNANASGDFTFSKKSRLQIDLGYDARSYSGYTRYRGQLYNSFIYRHLLYKDSWSMNITANDPLGREKNRSIASYPEQLIEANTLTNNRSLMLSLIFKFPLSQKFKKQVYKQKNDDEIRN